MTHVPAITLRDGNTIPQLGLGVWQVDPAITAKVVLDAIEAGYRLIDTAEGYHNEEGVGDAIQRSPVPRGELFITSKLRNGGHARDLALSSFDRTMRALGAIASSEVGSAISGGMMGAIWTEAFIDDAPGGQPPQPVAPAPTLHSHQSPGGARDRGPATSPDPAFANDMCRHGRAR